MGKSEVKDAQHQELPYVERPCISIQEIGTQWNTSKKEGGCCGNGR